MTAQTQHHANRKKRLDIVVPLFNEQEVVRQLHSRLTRTLEQLPFASRIIYVDDGSSDRTIEKLVETMKGTDCVELIRLSRNFGQTAAIQAGLAAADADAVVVMDGDLQDPPELIMEMVDHWMMGYEVVIARRTDRDEGSWYRKKAFQAFHRFFRWISDFDIPANCGTFCLLDRSAAKSIAHMPEAHRFFPGLRAWVGFEQGFVDYSRPKRAAGSPKQNFARLMRYAADGIFGFSRKPARILLLSGFAQTVLGVTALTMFAALAIFGVAGWEFGWPLGVSLLAILGGIQLLGLGIVAELGFRIYEQSKSRPSYIVENRARLGQLRNNETANEPMPSPTSDMPHRKAG